MLSHRIYLTAILTTTLILFSPWINAEPPLHDAPPIKPGPGFAQDIPGFSLPPHLLDLDLSEAQEDKIFYLLHSEAPAVRNNLKQQRRLRDEIDKLISAPNLDDKKSRQLATELARVQTDAIFSHISTELRIRALLTPEQLSRLDEKRELGKSRPGRPPFPAGKTWEGRPKEDIARPI